MAGANYYNLLEGYTKWRQEAAETSGITGQRLGSTAPAAQHAARPTCASWRPAVVAPTLQPGVSRAAAAAAQAHQALDRPRPISPQRPRSPMHRSQARTRSERVKLRPVDLSALRSAAAFSSKRASSGRTDGFSLAQSWAPSSSARVDSLGPCHDSESAGGRSEARFGRPASSSTRQHGQP